MKLKGSGSKEERYYYILNKNDVFFSLFSKFLLGCGFRDLQEYETHQESKPNIRSFENKVDHFKNDDYDIDIIFQIIE